VSGETPFLLETGFLIQLSWTGEDLDGEVAGFEWRLARCGPEGHDPNNLKTFDPESGNESDEWHFTTEPCTTLVLSTTPPDEITGPVEYFTIYVRAVDREGDSDPTPAILSFSASTLLPSIYVDRPPRMANYLDAQKMPPTVIFGFTGNDPDLENGQPIKWRYLLQEAWYENHYVRTAHEFNHLLEAMCSFSDPDWSDWLPYSDDPEERMVTIPDLPVRDEQGLQIIYLFALQAMDTTGAVSISRTFSRNVQCFYISESMSPYLTVYEPCLGTRRFGGVNSWASHEIASHQPLNFSWIATADDYAGEIAAYQWGWDVTDPDDPNDPNWAVMPGLSPQHMSTQPVTFGAGIHELTIQCWDNIDLLTRMRWVLEVVPIPPPEQQRPLLLVDDVLDKESNAWLASDGYTPRDHDEYRAAFWEDMLTGSGGVAGFSWATDVFDTEEEETFSFRDLAQYRAVIWTSRYASGNFTWYRFKPRWDECVKYQWLNTYQQYAGNLLLAGSRIMNEFLEEANWMIPWVFDTDEQYIECGGNMFHVGFGELELPDGNTVSLGVRRYPYTGMGLSMLDQVTPHYRVYGQCGTGSTGSDARSPACAGAKALLLDGDFRTAHAPAAIPDTILTSTTIDWRDLDPVFRDELGSYAWGNDEIYDGNISDRATAWSPQQCGAQPCVEPMFRIYSRFDWVDDLQSGLGNPEWPAPFLPDEAALYSHCGYQTFTPDWRTRTTGQVLGLVSHKHDDTKPLAQGDVLWGFDPYRFDTEAMRGTIHWVLGDHFGVNLNP